MSTSILKRRKIANVPPETVSKNYKSQYNFVFSSKISDWMFGTRTTANSKRKRYEEEKADPA